MQMTLHNCQINEVKLILFANW